MKARKNLKNQRLNEQDLMDANIAKGYPTALTPLFTDWRDKARGIYLSVLFCLTLSLSGYTQHRGDNFLFQGLAGDNDFGGRAIAMGSAFTAVAGDLNALYYNPAGLAGVKKIQISAGANRYSRLWRENQNYRPDKYFATLAFYLEELYIPDPLNSDSWDSGLFTDPSLSYKLTEPQMGKDPYSEDAADWKTSRSGYTLNTAAIAVPFKLFEENIVVGAAYSQTPINDFDRNMTYLTPHPGYTFYGNIAIANGKSTLSVDWHRFNRKREGLLHNVFFGLGYKVFDELSLGLSVKYSTGSSDDYLGYRQVGNFLLYSQNQFKFKYVAKLDTTTGTSDYQDLRLTLGAITSFSKFTVGAKVTLPATLSRDWSSIRRITKADTTVFNRYGTDKLKLGTAFALGMTYTPKNTITLAFDIEHTPYGSAEYEKAAPDSFFQSWANQTVFRVGFEWRPVKFLSFSAGYRNIPEVFVPDGAAVKDQGPMAASYTFGMGVQTGYGRADFCYEFRKTKYYDSYYSNTNYNTMGGNNFYIVYTVTL